jgi:signal transduction histidine kinase
MRVVLQVLLLILCISIQAWGQDFEKKLATLEKATLQNYVQLFEDLEREVRKNDFLEAYPMTEKIVSVSRKLPFHEPLCRSYVLQSDVYAFHGDFVNAFELLKNAYQFSLQKQLVSEQVFILYHWGKLYEDAYLDYQKAIEKHLEAADIAIKSKNAKLVAPIWLHLGNLYYRSKQYEKSLKFINRALDSDADGLQLREKIDAFNTLGLINQRFLSDDAKGEKYFNDALKLSIQCHDSAWYGVINGNIGVIYKNRKNYSEALRRFYIDYEYSLHFKEFQSAFLSKLDIAEIYAQTGQFELASEHLQQAEEIQKKYNITRGFPNLYKTYSVFYAERKEFEKALNYHILYKKMADSLSRNDAIAAALKTQSTYDLNQKEREVIMLKQERKLEEARNRQQNIIIFGLSGVILIFLVASVMLFRLNQQNQSKKRQLILQNEWMTAKNNEIEMQAEDLKELNQVKDKLFSIVSHDFRNPLNSLRGFIALIKEEELTVDEIKIIVERLDEKVAQTLGFLDNLLNWAKNQMEGMKYVPQFFDIHDILKNELKGTALQVSQKKIILENHISEHIRVYGDPDMTRLILRNLISNAIKFTHENGKIILSSEKAGEMIRINVIDTGRGMTNEEIEKILNTNDFYTSQGTASEIGTGLGLVLVKEFVEKNGGNIYIKSQPGEGTTFSFTMLAGHKSGIS